MTGREVPVSVVIPCYNQARYLGDAIESALSQDWGRPEVIVVDDGSTEDLTSVVGRYPGVRLLAQPNLGVAAARNAGFSASCRPYVVFLDADDRLMPDALRVGVELLEANARAGCAIGLCRIIGPRGEQQPFRQEPPVVGDAYPALLKSNFVWMPGEAIYRRECFAATGGFDVQIPAAADYDLYLRLARERRIVVHRHVVAEYRMHDENMSGNGLLMLESALKVLERQRGFARSDPEYLAAYLQGSRFWRDFYGDRAVQDIRASLRVPGRRGRAFSWSLRLLYRHPRAVAFHAARKLRNLVRQSVRG